jgi:hypothetical protein
VILLRKEILGRCYVFVERFACGIRRDVADSVQLENSIDEVRGQLSFGERVAIKARCGEMTTIERWIVCVVQAPPRLFRNET